MKDKEPDFMKELHRIRARLTKEWGKMSDQEFLVHMHKIGKKLKQSFPVPRTTSISH